MQKMRIYQPGNYQLDDVINLGSDAAHHVSVVKRMQVNDKLILFRGDNEEFEAIITSINKKKVQVIILSKIYLNLESTLSIHLMQAISKGARMEMVVQKAVELGVASITPLITMRTCIFLDSARLEKKRLQWQAIAIAACEQCGRNKIPEIYPIVLLKEYLQNLPKRVNFVLSPYAQKSLDYNQAFSEIGLLVGAEGGLTVQEIELVSSYDFLPLQLGPRTLRTETATIVGLSILQAMFGDLLF